MPRVRLASALLVPEPVAREIDGLRRALGDNVERVPPHLTLVPPVNVRVEDVGAVLASVRSAAAAMSPLAVTLGPPVTFHPVNPVVYLSIAGDVDGVRAVRDAVFIGPLSRRLEHDFVPHVTLVESTTPARIDAALVALADYRVDTTFESVHLLQEDERIWRPIAEARFEPPLVVGRGGIETEITVSSIADPEVGAFMGEPRNAAEQVVVARRDGLVVAAACAVGGELLSFVGDPDLERQLLKAIAPS
jgi:2'-5' RNA ligase